MHCCLLMHVHSTVVIQEIEAALDAEVEGTDDYKALEEARAG